MKKLKQLQTLSFFALGTLFICSCAVEPIKISQPIGVPVAQNKVAQHEVRVVIEDVRGTQVLGSRGGIYSETSLISSDDSLIDQIGDNFIFAMKSQGYQLLAQAPANMKVTLESLTYDVVEVNRTTKDSKVFVKMSFYVENTKAYMQKDFNIELSQTTVILPTQKSIEKWINSALIQVMQKGLDDKDIQLFIANSQSMEQMENSFRSIDDASENKATSEDPVQEMPVDEEPKEEIKQPESQTFKLLL